MLDAGISLGQASGYPQQMQMQSIQSAEERKSFSEQDSESNTGHTYVGMGVSHAAKNADRVSTEAIGTSRQTFDDVQQRLNGCDRVVQLSEISDDVSRKARRPTFGGAELPASLKSGIEQLSGLSMEHVRVHYNSSQPSKLNALAYAQGSEIHLGHGQEQHLPHEAWHVVQQLQGRVRTSFHVGGTAVNNEAKLENEADNVARMFCESSVTPPINRQLQHRTAQVPGNRGVVQRNGGNVSTTIDQLPQKGAGWCYAAVSAILRRKNSGENVTVEDVVREFLLSGFAVLRDPDTLESIRNMNDRDLLTRYGDQYGYEQLNSLTKKSIGYDLDEIEAELSAGRPVLFVMQRHSVVIIGINRSDETISYWDPMAKEIIAMNIDFLKSVYGTAEVHAVK